VAHGHYTMMVKQNNLGYFRRKCQPVLSHAKYL